MIFFKERGSKIENLRKRHCRFWWRIM